jgi:gentisate 1,2-dioxygenase
MRFADEPQSFLERFVEPVDGPTHSLHVHFEEYAPGGRRHGHVNEVAFYILEGRRYEVHDSVRYDWQAGDMAIAHNNCACTGTSTPAPTSRRARR